MMCGWKMGGLKNNVVLSIISAMYACSTCPYNSNNIVRICKNHNTPHFCHNSDIYNIYICDIQQDNENTYIFYIAGMGT